MLLMGMPGLPEWIIFLILIGIIIFAIRSRLKRKRLTVQTQHQNQNQQQQTNLTVNTFSLSSELEKLGDLKAKGIITEEEFQEQKKKILNS